MNINIDNLIKEACNLSKLDGGLDYKVGVKGSKLSGGQKQIIAIARAI
jgi:ABC-type bacteriocin/lantibiotic exporter with double-glycine peptidase domain